MFLTSSVRCCASHRVMNCCRQYLPTAQLTTRSCAYSMAVKVQQGQTGYRDSPGKEEVTQTPDKTCRCDRSVKSSDSALQSISDLHSHCVVSNQLTPTSADGKNLTQNTASSIYNHNNISLETVVCANTALSRTTQAQQSGGILSLCDIKSALLSRTVQLSNGVKRHYSSLNFGSRPCMHNLNSCQTSCRKLLDNSGNSYIHGAPTYRTNYMGKWDGPAYRKTPPWRVLFFGTDFIALDTLKLLHENMKVWSPVVGSLDVVTGKAQMPVRKYAETQHLPIHDWPVTPDNSNYDVGVLVSFGHMIPDKIIHMFPYGILNMHPSLLPRWRGASPIIHAVLAGDTKTGISITEIRPKHFDIGPILMQQELQMPSRPDSLQMANVLGKLGAHMVVETLRDLPTLERSEHEQDENRGVTYAHKIVKQNGYIDWENSTAEQVDRQYRALGPVVPIRTKWHDTIVRLHRIVDPKLLIGAESGLHPRYKGNIHDDLPGTPVWHKELDCIVIKCKEGLIGFGGLTLRRPLTAKDFHNGYLNDWDGTRFTSVDNELYRYVKSDKIPAMSMA